VKQISDNEIYLLIKYIKNVLWRVAKSLSYTEDARCLKVNTPTYCNCIGTAQLDTSLKATYIILFYSCISLHVSYTMAYLF